MKSDNETRLTHKACACFHNATKLFVGPELIGNLEHWTELARELKRVDIAKTAITTSASMTQGKIIVVQGQLVYILREEHKDRCMRHLVTLILAQADQR